MNNHIDSSSHNHIDNIIHNKINNNNKGGQGEATDQGDQSSAREANGDGGNNNINNNTYNSSKNIINNKG